MQKFYKCFSNKDETKHLGVCFFTCRESFMKKCVVLLLCNKPAFSLFYILKINLKENDDFITVFQ